MKLFRYVPFVFFGLFLTACTPQTAKSPNGGLDNGDNDSQKVSSAPLIKPAVQVPPLNAANEFTTDFSINSVDFKEILSGGPPRDGIPPIDHPKFINVEEAGAWLQPKEPIILVDLNTETKAYPLQILVWHEIVNDSVGGIPVIVTFCPLCNTAIVFRRTINGEVLDFGTTGRLRFSNLIMYDRQTETWWQQAEGKGIIGVLTGTQLEFVPAAIVSWDEFSSAYPDGLVLSTETGFARNYGQNPYLGYDDINKPPFLYQGPETPDKLPPVARVLAVEIGTESVAYPFELLKDVHVVNDIVGGQAITVFWSSGTASALDAFQIADGRDVGTAIAYSRQIQDKEFKFTYDGEKIIDKETGSTWDILGNATSGELAGSQLDQVVAVDHFWFSWVAFKPETRVFQP